MCRCVDVVNVVLVDQPHNMRMIVLAVGVCVRTCLRNQEEYALNLFVFLSICP